MSHQIKPEQNKSSYTSFKKIWNLSSMRLGNISTRNNKRGEVQQYVSMIEKNSFQRY